MKYLSLIRILPERIFIDQDAVESDQKILYRVRDLAQINDLSSQLRKSTVISFGEIILENELFLLKECSENNSNSFVCPNFAHEMIAFIDSFTSKVLQIRSIIKFKQSGDDENINKTIENIKTMQDTLEHSWEVKFLNLDCENFLNVFSDILNSLDYAKTVEILINATKEEFNTLAIDFVGSVCNFDFQNAEIIQRIEKMRTGIDENSKDYDEKCQNFSYSSKLIPLGFKESLKISKIVII